ncbi:MAG: hypothetical protein E6K70_16025 [Planctomycetota bacterium]|nr:MAG: hypothetical protein E6K70_16025 [Planctomycetota bacterium]
MIVSYDDKESRPALIERNFDPKAKVRGRVLLYTTPLDARHLGITLDRAHPNKEPRWNDYLTTSFFQVMVYVTTNYLAGSAESMNFNYLSGQTVTVSLPATPRSPTYTLQGPGINAAESVVPRAEGQGELSLTQPVMPGNYTLRGAEGDWRTQFSVNMPPEESQLSRVPPEQIEQLLGPKCILPIGQGANFREVLQGHWSQPIELFPWIMIMVLLALAVENLLANKFYRRETQENLEAAAPAQTTQA